MRPKIIKNVDIIEKIKINLGKKWGICGKIEKNEEMTEKMGKK